MKTSKAMNTVLLVIRWIVGILFIFSGLIKANDPLGLSYKMQEFFDAWQMTYLNDYALPLALILNVFEVLAGVAIIIGWRIKVFSWLLLLLIIFFAFLTGYATYSGKFKSCGCFGDCIPLTPLQSFIKDLILLVLIIVIFVYRNKIPPAFNNMTLPLFILLFTVMGVSLFETYALTYLPPLDCLPYRVGNNLIEQMQPTAGSVPDSTQLIFIYKKNGKEVRFDQDHFPDDFNDSSYQYVKRYEKLIRKGNDTPPISDFSLKTFNGTDTTQAILHQPYYVLLFIQNFSNWNEQGDNYQNVDSVCKKKNIPLFIVTPLPDVAKELLPQAHILQGDATVIKTAARVNGTYYVMQGPVVKQKESYVNSDKVIATLNK